MSQLKSLGRREFLVNTLAGASALAASGAGLTAASEPAKKWRLGVIGSGARSRLSHLPILCQYFPEVEIVALCDITPENLQQGLRLCSGSTAAYSDYKRMLGEHPELDAVVICVPNYLHAEMALQALEAGKHVVTEKPMALHMADVERMIQTARRRKRILQVGFEMRYSTVFHRMGELVRQGAIGDMEYIFAALFRGDWNPHSWKYTDPVTKKRTNWRFLTFTAGSALLEDGIHELDVIQMLVSSEPKRIQAQGGNNVFRDRETIDNAGLLIEFANGVRCNFAFTLFTPGIPNPITLRLFGSQGEIALEREGKTQALIIRRNHAQAEHIPISSLQPEEVGTWKGEGARHYNTAFEEDNEISTYRMYKDFLHSISSGEQPISDGKVGRDAVHIGLAAERSLRTGRPLSWDESQEVL